MAGRLPVMKYKGKYWYIDEMNKQEGNLLQESEAKIKSKLTYKFDPQQLEDICSISPHLSYELFRTSKVIEVITKYRTITGKNYPKEIVEHMFLGKVEYFLRFVKQVELLVGEPFQRLIKNQTQRTERKRALLKELTYSELKDVDDLTTLNKIIFLDDAARHFEVDWLGDYIVRKSVATYLFNKGKLETQHPFKTPQTKLYDLIEEQVK